MKHFQGGQRVKHAVIYGKFPLQVLHSPLYTVILLLWKITCIPILTLKSPITTAADDKFCDIYPNFQQKIRYDIT